MKYFIAVIIFSIGMTLPVSLFSQSAHSWLRQADKSYEIEDYPAAEDNYRRALEKDKSAKGTYNLGNSTYRQERFDEAAKHYEATAESAKDRPTKSKAYHNLGNAYFQKKEFDKSVEAYKNALRQIPSDLDTKRNLALALQQLKQQRQQQQKDQQQQSKNEDQKQDDQKDQQQQQQQKSSDSKEQPQDLSKEEASKLLEIMDREEQKVQEKLRKAQSKPTKPKKDW